MSLNERTGVRDLMLNMWHRPPNLPRDWAAFDIDLAPVCPTCSNTLMLYEGGCGYHSRDKATRFTGALARQADVPAYLVLYDVVDGRISETIRVGRIEGTSRTRVQPYSLDALARLEGRIRAEHRCAA